MGKVVVLLLGLKGAAEKDIPLLVCRKIGVTGEVMSLLVTPTEESPLSNEEPHITDAATDLPEIVESILCSDSKWLSNISSLRLFSSYLCMSSAFKRA